MTEEKEIRSELETQPIGKLLLQYSIPSIISAVVIALYNIIDRVFIGQGVGSYAISGLTLTFPLMAIVSAIGTLVGVGASARISIVLGMKDVKWAKKILSNAFVLTLLLSFVFISISMIWMEEILSIFGGSENTIPYAAEYLRIVIPASIFINICYNFSNIMRSSGYPTKSMVVILVGVILNTILDPIFIFVFDMGISGAAWATAISMLVSSVLAMLHFTNRKHIVFFERGSFKLEGYIIRNIISIGMAPFLVNVAGSMVNIIMNHSLVRYGGDLAIGAYGIINSYAFFAVMVVTGLCQGMQPIVGYNFGARKMKRVKDTLTLAIKWGMLITTIAFVICEAFPGLLVKAFSRDPELLSITRNGLRIVFLAFPFVGYQIVVSQFFLSISKASKAIFMTLSRQVLFLIPLLYLLSSVWELNGVWSAIPVADLSATVVAFLFLVHEKRQYYGKRRIRPRHSK